MLPPRAPQWEATHCSSSQPPAQGGETLPAAVPAQRQPVVCQAAGRPEGGLMRVGACSGKRLPGRWDRGGMSARAGRDGDTCRAGAGSSAQQQASALPLLEAIQAAAHGGAGLRVPTRSDQPPPARMVQEMHWSANSGCTHTQAARHATHEHVLITPDVAFRHIQDMKHVRIESQRPPGRQLLGVQLQSPGRPKPQPPPWPWSGRCTAAASLADLQECVPTSGRAWTAARSR